MTAPISSGPTLFTAFTPDQAASPSPGAPAPALVPGLRPGPYPRAFPARGPVEFRGALDLEDTAVGVRPRRLPAWTRAQYPDAWMDEIAALPSGVRLVFRTAATVLELGVLTTVGRSPEREPAVPVFDLVVDGAPAGRLAAPPGVVVTSDEATRQVLHVQGAEPGRLRLPPALLPQGDKQIELWLPQHTAVELAGLWSDAPIRPPEPSRRLRWVHHGSSISHCFEADGPTGTWPAVAAARAGAELVNLGLAGNAMADPYTARALRDQPADLISVKLGINPVNGATLRMRTFIPAVHGFLDTIREGHPDTPLLLISPISCPIVETTPGPTDPVPGDPAHRFAAHGDPADGDALTLVSIRAALAQLAARRAADDPNLRYLDGRELFGPADLDHLPDALHPDAEGYRRMGERFADRVLIPGFAALPRPDAAP